MIRKAEAGDIPRILQLVHSFYDESLRDYNISLHDNTARNTIRSLINEGVFLVGIIEGKIIGIIAGAIAKSIFDDKQIMAQEIVWYVSPSDRKGRIGFELIEEYTKECKKRGATRMIMVHMENLNPLVMNRLYTKRHFKLMEFQYIKEI